MVTEFHPCGFIIDELLHIEQIYAFFIPSLKITSGEISADEVAGGEHRQSRDWANKQQRASQVRIHQGSQRIKTTSIASKFILQKISDNPSFNSVHQYTNQPVITHPEERIWAEQRPRRQLRSPDAPKIKHDRMKQFYMVDMGRKRW